MARHHSPEAGSLVCADEDQPRLPASDVIWQGRATRVQPAVQNVWLLQRGLGYFASLDDDQQQRCRDLLSRRHGDALLNIRIERPPLRRHNRFCYA